MTKQNSVLGSHANTITSNTVPKFDLTSNNISLYIYLNLFSDLLDFIHCFTLDGGFSC